jgi:hypothetical protein
MRGCRPSPNVVRIKRRLRDPGPDGIDHGVAGDSSGAVGDDDDERFLVLKETSARSSEPVRYDAALVVNANGLPILAGTTIVGSFFRGLSGPP